MLFVVTSQIFSSIIRPQKRGEIGMSFWVGFNSLNLLQYHLN
ncbi:hypothetical protein VIBNISO65_460074 [Vibrio nigripulchritudo SO65]|nr:hypothetical protein VIBNIAM115_1850030 [Vibrio nigripulchritudo AM115]CCN39426.1 hypothetical protein VIBNIFTn2_1040074 [Vibrio nigripulchritudo FTn2]CCN63477.1 hypothetical protein VIBNIPon4_130072 [Vibrio nigripulchritudo POn4]CCN78106.1 hypothetical protein VIBNISO65_460074 [Vibrio nigripulchritudo SO65]